MDGARVIVGVTVDRFARVPEHPNPRVSKAVVLSMENNPANARIRSEMRDGIGPRSVRRGR